MLFHFHTTALIISLAGRPVRGPPLEASEDRQLQKQTRTKACLCLLEPAAFQALLVVVFCSGAEAQLERAYYDRQGIIVKHSFACNYPS